MPCLFLTFTSFLRVVRQERRYATRHDYNYNLSIGLVHHLPFTNIHHRYCFGPPLSIHDLPLSMVFGAFFVRVGCRADVSVLSKQPKDEIAAGSRHG